MQWQLRKPLFLLTLHTSINVKVGFDICITFTNIVDYLL